jgi:hypothetical protein
MLIYEQQFLSSPYVEGFAANFLGEIFVKKMTMVWAFFPVNYCTPLNKQL